MTAIHCQILEFEDSLRGKIVVETRGCAPTQWNVTLVNVVVRHKQLAFRLVRLLYFGAFNQWPEPRGFPAYRRSLCTPFKLVGCLPHHRALDASADAPSLVRHHPFFCCAPNDEADQPPMGHTPV